MPADTIKRAIEKATGGGEAEQYEEIVYEGYGPGGVAVLVEAATDNRNRTAADVRSIFAKAGGQLAGIGRGRLAVRAARPDHRPARPRHRPRRGGADGDRRRRRGRRHGRRTRWRSTRLPATSSTIRRALEQGGVKVESAESAMIAKQTVELDPAKARQALRLVEMLEDLDDVQRVTANFEIPEEVFAEVAG